jgi:uncharacterized protein YjhX (UPF0386 family)
MKMAGTFLSTWLLVGALLSVNVEAKAPNNTAGEDPFPLRCVDFSGTWKSDNGGKYKISQSDCKQLTIQMIWNNYTEDTISIVPDDRLRSIPGMERAAIRHRWNSNREGKIIESHRTWIDGINKITEIVTYERATTGLLLETTYTTIECLTRPGQVVRDYEQQVFRRMGAGKPDDGALLEKEKKKAH